VRLRESALALLGEHPGTAIVWVALMLPMLLSIVGVSIDAGLALNTRRQLQDTADSAARAAAEQIDLNTYRSSSGASVVLDFGKARDVANSYLNGLPAGTASAVNIEQQRAVVQLSREMPTTFLKVAHINSVRITAVAPATVRYGIQQPNT